MKDLSQQVLAVSLLKRENDQLGPGEKAGVRLGDIIFGINFIPTRHLSKTLIKVIKREQSRGRKYMYLQGWRCHQLCSDPIPGKQFPKADDVIVQAYSLVKSGCFSDWERWNFIEILLGFMLEDLKIRASSIGSKSLASITPAVSPASEAHSSFNSSRIMFSVSDLEKNIMRAKGLRGVLCVRIVHTRTKDETVVYALRVEDVESGLQWVVHRRYRDFYLLNEKLLDLSNFAKEVEFPRKRIALRNSSKLIETRILALEQYIRKLLHNLILYSSMDASASKSLRQLQTFLGVPKFIDCLHPPLVDDQRFIEMMAYRFLNDMNSPSCQQCARFIANVNLDSLAVPGENGYNNVLAYMKDALSEVEQFVQERHQSEMVEVLKRRNKDLTEEQLYSFTRKCIRRQVEASLFLPLRRNLFRIVYSYLALKSQNMHQAMSKLRHAPPEFFQVPQGINFVKDLPVTVKMFRRVIQAYLPTDQGELLVLAANFVTNLHHGVDTEVKNPETSSNIADKDTIKKHKSKSHQVSSNYNEKKRQVRANSVGAVNTEDIVREEMPNLVSKEILANPVGFIFMADENQSEGDSPPARRSFINVELPDVREEDVQKVDFTVPEEGGRSRRNSRRNSNGSYDADGNVILENNTAKLGIMSVNEISLEDLEGCERLHHSQFMNGENVNYKEESSPEIEERITKRLSSMSANLELNALLDSYDDQLFHESTDSKNLTIADPNLVDSKNELQNADDEEITESIQDVNPLSSLADSVQLEKAAVFSPPGASNTKEMDSSSTVLQANFESNLTEEFTAQTRITFCGNENREMMKKIISADDFLPLFTYVLVQAGLPQLLLVKELMVNLIDDEESYGECGYYLATLEAATEHIMALAEQYQGGNDEEINESVNIA